MTNNLAKIAKDLRAFAKRCKNVHYSDSLLISFILSGILSLASISFSDTFDNLSDSQKEAAMDSINEMRQQINYARKDNDKLIKGSSLELVKLMEQGDQVVKSPWGSQQFGFGYTYNSWGTSFKGRGGKQNDIKYRRTNDLTKYVFDPNLHEYGATNLHIKRNKEPDVLVINPANVHKSYTPPTATRMDAMTMIDGPQFNPQIKILNGAYYGLYSINVNGQEYTDPKIADDYNAAQYNSLNLTTSTSDYSNNQNNNNTSSGSATLTTALPGNLKIEGSTNRVGWYHTGTSWTGSSINALTRGVIHMSDVNNLTSSSYYISYSDLNGATGGNNQFYNEHTGHYGEISAGSSTADKIFLDISNNFTINPSIINTGSRTFDIEFNIDRGSGFTAVKNSSGTLNFVNDDGYTIFNINGNNNNGIYNLGTIDYSTGNYYNQFNINGNSNNGIYSTGTVNSSFNTFNINGNNNNGIYSTRTASITNSNFNVNDGVVNGYDYNTGVLITSGSNSSSSSNYTVNGSRSSGIFLTGGSITSSGDEISVEGSESNGIYLSSGTSSSTIDNYGRGFIKVSGGSSNGVFVKRGATVTTVDDDFTISGNGSNGINIESGATVGTVQSSSFTVGGSGNSSNGIYAQSGSTLSNIDSTTFSVTGDNSNGANLQNGLATNFSNITATVSGSGSTGITLNTQKLHTFTNANTFTVSGGNASSGIYLYDNKGFTMDATGNSANSSFYVSNNSIGVGINVNDSVTEPKTITFSAASTPGNTHYRTYMKLTGNGNSGSNLNTEGSIGFNIQNGRMTDASPTDAKKKVEIKGMLDVDVAGDNNELYKNNSYVSELKISNGSGLSSTGTADTNAMIGSYNNGYGLIDVDGNRNIVFSNLGYVKNGVVDLNAITIDGNNNAVAYFAGSNVDFRNAGTGNEGKIGYFGTTAADVLKLQGSIGGNGSSNANVGVYAVSGQRKGLGTYDAIGDNTSGSGNTLSNLNVSDLNIGFSKYSTNGTLVYSAKGTVVEVKNDSAAYNRDNTTNTTKTISDGIVLDNKSGGNFATYKWGYTTDYDLRSTGTTIAYSKGVWDWSGLMYDSTPTALTNSPSEIIIGSAVDMASKSGIAYRAEAGGKVTVGSSILKSGTDKINTRAGGTNSVIAYADGNNVTNVKHENSGNYASKKGNIHMDSSLIEIQGDIVAADDGVFSSNVSGSTAADKLQAYNNIAAYAVRGGDILIKTSSNAPTDAKEADDTKAAGTNGSLIYGLGAYASGSGSNVIYTLNGKGATIISGTKGALYAEDNGYVEFKGNIVNQNNDVATVMTDTTNATVKDSSSRSGTGQNLIGRDHDNVAPFFVKRSSFTDEAAITFNDTTNIDMYNGVLLVGNEYYHNNALSRDYNRGFSDYYGAADIPATSDEQIKYKNAKYRGMENVNVKILSNDVNLGLVNQYGEELNWDSDRNKTSSGTNFLQGIADYAKLNKIENFGTNSKRTNNEYSFSTSLINGKLKVTADVDLEDHLVTGSDSTISGATNKNANDPFNDIAMESELVTFDDNVNVAGDVKYLAGKKQGLNMANSLYRWNDDDLKNRRESTASLVKTEAKDSGYILKKANLNVWGGSANPGDSITGVNVAYGTIDNQKDSKIYVDHGNGIVGTDGSILKNEGKIYVTGKYDPATQAAYTGLTATPRTGATVETQVDSTKGENYGIVGISTQNVREHQNYGGNRYGENKVEIENKDGSIEVDGKLAVGIYGENINQSGTTFTDQYAKKSNINIAYDNQNSTSPDAIKVNYGAGTASGTQTVKENKALRGVGIALVEHDKDRTAANRGGIITLNTQNKGIANTADILTFENGIGIYGESADIRFKGDSTGLTVDTGSDGAGVWVTDDSNISSHADRIAGAKTLNYNYKGYDNKKGFAMVFGSTDSNNAYGGTNATNYMDIKFNNNGDTGVTLAIEKSKTAPGAAAPVNTPGTGTYKGIAGILVNTDKGRLDTVTNYGDIKEDTSKTHVRSYGAVVNSGNFVNWGNIELSDSLLSDAANVEKNDLKKVNVGILANDHENGRANTYIESHGDIKVGTTSNQNVGGFGIYGYNVTTGPKADGSESTITINRNSYGVYSGDGTVNIQKGTKLLVGNDTVLGHEQTTKGTSSAAGAYPINRQTAYTAATDLLPGRTTDAAVGVYIGSNENLSKQNRNVDVSANMDIDRYSYGIVLAENNGGATTNVTIGSPTYSPTINLASNTKAGGQVKSHVPTNPAIPEEVYEQGNAVYYYSADKNSKGTTYANVTMNGDYNTAYRTAGSIDNYGTIDLRSQWDIANPTVDKTTGETINLGYGNLGIVSENPDIASTNYGKIITGMSDTQNMRYSAAMAAGRNVYDSNNTFVKTEADGYVINRGDIVVQAKDGIGMFATGSRSRAINYGNISLVGDNSTGMYLDRGAIGENYGTIEGSANNLRGVVAINGGYIKNYGTINVTGQNSNGIVTDSSRFIVDANGNPVKILSPTDAQYDSSQATTAGQNNGKDGSKDLYGGKESSIAEYTSGNPKTTGVGTTIAMPSVVPMTTITVDGVNTPIFTVDTDAATQGQWGEKISITSSIQTGGTRIIDLSQLDGWGNKMWNNYHTDQLSEVTSIGMYVDTSGVKYSNPINGIQNLKNLGEVNLYFGSEATLYTNAKAIRLGTNILKPFNDSLTNLPGGAVVNPLSASLTWQVAAKLDDKNQLTDVYMSKVPYHSFAYDDDTSLVNFTNNLDNVYEIVDFHTNEKEIFNKLNSLGNGEGHILAQAFDQMRAHIYGGIQQRTVATEKIFDSQVSGVMSSNGMVGNPSKDSTKYKAFGERGEYKTDTKGIPDYENYAGGFVAVHEGESIYKGEKHGWYTGVVDNNFSFKDIARSHENQAMIKGGLFKTTPFDVNGEFTWTIAGEGYFGRTDTNRRFWVVDKQYDAEAHYYTYGVALKNELAKSFRLSEGFAIKPHVGIDLEYGRYSSFHEDGTMSLDVKGNDYHSIKPNLGVDFTYKQPVFKKSMFVASLGLGYEKELGRVNDVTNEARIQGAWTDYFSIRGDKENKKGNYKADLNLGIDNGRLGFTVNAGYDSTGKNFRGGAGLRFIF